jgi:hypothetical protein
MTVEEALAAAAGSWTGTNRLRMLPEDEYEASDSTALVQLPARGRFVCVTYTWSREGTAHDGLLLLGDGEAPDSAVGVWIDSWHQSSRWMELRGTVDAAGSVSVDGSYPFGPEATAGWRIRLEAGGDAFLLAMDNIVPADAEPGFAGADYQVVEASYVRAP